MKIFWEKKFAKRRIQSDVYEPLPMAMLKFRMPQKKGTKNKWENVLVKDGVRYQHVHIRDIFPEPNTTDWSRLIHRDKLTYNEINQMTDQGFFDKDSVKELWGVYENDNFEVDCAPVKYDLEQTDPKLPRPDYDKRHTVWEYNGPLPLKWINLDMPEETEEQKKAAGEVTPGIALIASSNYYLTSGESQTYDGEHGFIKMDYIPDGTYGIGVAGIMGGQQDELNEITNQRLDNVCLLMNKMLVVIEKYVVDPKEWRSKPGAIMRLKGSEIDDIRKVFAELQISDVPISSYRETAEIERKIQETTAANRVTTGTAGMVKDTNQTLGGMELMKQAAFDRFLIYAFLIGRTFDVRAAKKTSETIYLNASDDAIKRILGMVPIEMMPGQYIPRWECWKRQEPRDLNVCYDFVPVDVFSMENKYQKSQDLASKGQLMATLVPGWNPVPLLKRLFKYSDMSSDEISEILEGLPQGPMATPMGQGMGVPSIARPTKQNVGESSPMPTPSAQGGGPAPIG
jgi:hypothetical protein